MQYVFDFFSLLCVKTINCCFCHLPAGPTNADCCVRDKIFNLRTQLCGYVELNSGLFDELQNSRVLKKKQLSRIQAALRGKDVTDFDKIDGLLTCLLKKDRYIDVFMSCLEKTDQEHIINYIDGNGGELLKLLLSVNCLMCLIIVGDCA